MDVPISFTETQPEWKARSRPRSLILQRFVRAGVGVSSFVSFRFFLFLPRAHIVLYRSSRSFPFPLALEVARGEVFLFLSLSSVSRNSLSLSLSLFLVLSFVVFG